MLLLVFYLKQKEKKTSNVFFKEALLCNFSTCIILTVDFRFTFIIMQTFIRVYGFSNNYREWLYLFL